MKLLVLIICTIQLYLLLFLLPVAIDAKPPKRSNISLIPALMPSLRIGRRSDNVNTWDGIAPPDVIRRNKFVAAGFPRRADGRKAWRLALPGGTNRDGHNQDTDYYYNNDLVDVMKRTESNGGLWFGPRLGRVQKRNVEGGEGNYNPWEYLPLNDRQVHHYTPRLGRESDEITSTNYQDEDGILDNLS